MISAGAVSALQHLFELAIRDNAVNSGDECEIAWQTDGRPAMEDDAPGMLIVMNIVSYLFRIVALFHFSVDDATNRYMAHLTRDKQDVLDTQGLRDALCELVNVICGEVNRGLAVHYPHAGMSTPFVLESACVRYIDFLEPKQVMLLSIRISDTVGFSLTLCICLAPGSDLDFTLVEKSAESGAGVGELEMF